MKTIRIATRKSKLALWQAEWVKSKLEESGLSAELVTIETKGDKILDRTISKIGSKGVFTEELEEMLATGEVDIAVHSAKDLSSTMPEGFEIISVGERSSVNDVLISNEEIDLAAPLKVGTASTRRVAQLAKFYPNFETVPIRGNLQTRIEKMESGECQAIVLAKAGVERMGYENLIKHEFSINQLTPAAGQGSIAIETFETIHPTIRKLIKAATNDTIAFQNIQCERSFLKTMEGGCSIPVFAHCTKDQEVHRLHGGILSLDGTQCIESKGSDEDPVVLGKKIAARVLEEGGDKILKEIKSQLDYL